MADAARNVDMKVVTAKEAELENADDDDGDKGGPMKMCQLSIRGVEAPIQIHMNTAALENKISALEIIKGLAHTLGPLFIDFVQPVSTLLVTELMHNQISTAVRKIATKTLSHLLLCTKDQAQMKELITLYIPGFASAIKNYVEKLDFSTVKWLTLELSRCIKHFYNWKGQAWVSDQFLIETLDLLSKVI